MFQDVDVLIQVRFVPELGRQRLDTSFFTSYQHIQKQLSIHIIQVICSPYHASNDSNITREGVLFCKTEVALLILYTFTGNFMTAEITKNSHSK